LARAYLVLQDQELKAARYLCLWYRRMSSAYFQIKAARAQRESFAKQLQIRYELYRVGANEPQTGNPVTLNLLLEAQRFWAEALATEYQAIVTYNNAICGWEFAKATIMQHDNVTITEGPIPVAAQKRAVEHLRERTKALVLRERAAPMGTMAKPLEMSGPINVYRQINAGSLPSIWKDAPPLTTEVGDLPPPDKIDEAGNPLQTMPVNQVFPESELPAGAKQLPEILPPANPATPFLPPANKTSSAHPAKPKAKQTTSTFGTIRLDDDPASLLPVALPPSATPSAVPAVVLPDAQSLATPPPPISSGPGSPQQMPPATSQPLLPLNGGTGK
jgi:hypothetical protein